MPKGKRTEDTTMLSMALIGYEMEKQKIEEKIAEIKAQIGGRPAASTAPAAKKSATAKAEKPAQDGRRTRTLSPAARKRIALAQKKRWAEHRKRVAAGKQA